MKSRYFLSQLRVLSGLLCNYVVALLSIACLRCIWWLLKWFIRGLAEVSVYITHVDICIFEYLHKRLDFYNTSFESGCRIHLLLLK